MVLKDPEGWAAFIKPWVIDLIPVPIAQFMIGTGVLDIAIGILLMFDTTLMIGSLLGTLHLITVLLGSGVNSVTVRDIAILTSVFSAFIESLPNKYKVKSHE